MSILITGATGFIGSRLAEELRRRGEDIVCLCRSPRNSQPLSRMGARIFYGDVTDEASLRMLPACDVIFHCAAIVEDCGLKRLRECNVGGTRNVCRLARRTRAKRLVYLSSVAVASGNPVEVLTEDLPYSATNNYGISKIEAEKAVLEARENGLACVVLRPPMVYGEGEPHAQDLLLRLLSRRLFPLFDNGRHRLHMAYVGNVVAALLLAMESPAMLNGTFFCADSDVLTAAETFGALASSIGAPAPFSLSPGISSFLSGIPLIGKKIAIFRKDRSYDTSRIVRAGYKDTLPAAEALARTGYWWKTGGLKKGII